MNTMNRNHRRSTRRAGAPRLAVFLALALLCLVAAAYAAPEAGTSIGNQASATYTDNAGTQHTVTSNVVSTVVQQVASLTLTANTVSYGSPGGSVSFPHTFTNTGNGTDTFTLALAQLGGDDFNLTGLAIYPDANGDGVPDSLTAITSTGALAPGAQFRFVVMGTIPPAQTSGQDAQLTVTATSAFDGGVSNFNTDTATVTNNAVLRITKSVSSSSGAPGTGPYTYTFTYTNSGNATAAGLTLTDTVPTGMAYVADSGRWSKTGATTLTDADETDNQSGIIYDWNVTTAGKVTAVIASIAAGDSGTLTFQVNVNAGVAAGVINNVADYTYDDNNGAGADITTATNTVPFTVTRASSATFTGSTVATAYQGAEVTFTNTLTNTGNATDTFDVTMGASTFPAGTTFVLFRSDGATPLLDTNGNGTPDTGPVAAAGTFIVKLRATLPADYSGPADLTVDKIATSENDPTKTATATDTLEAVTANTVDVTNDKSIAGGALAADGLGAGPEGAAIRTKTVDPGNSAAFVLYVNNTSNVADSYTLSASTDNTFAAITLPAGATVTFTDANGAVISSTPVLASNGSCKVTATITTSGTTPPATSDIYFRARSANTGAQDIKHDALTVNVKREISLTPSNTGQAYPGGSVVFTHIVTNNGNVEEGDAVGSATALAAADSLAGFSSAIYWDKNNNGVLDPDDPVINSLDDLAGGSGGASTDAGLDAGESATLFVKVFPPPGAAINAVDITTITATTANVGYASAAPAAAQAQDATTIIAGDLRLDKYQALDAAGDGTPDGAYSTSAITTGAVPGACVRYKIVVTNTGSAAATAVTFNDATPSYTVYDDGDGTTNSAVGHAVMTTDNVTFTEITHPANGVAGAISAAIGALNPGASVTIYFGVRIQP